MAFKRQALKVEEGVIRDRQKQRQVSKVLEIAQPRTLETTFSMINTNRHIPTSSLLHKTSSKHFQPLENSGN